MHFECDEFVKWVAKNFSEYFDEDILEAGSYDVNGEIRTTLGLNAKTYTGIDWRPGPGVDIVSFAHKFESDKKYKAVVSTSMLEHDPHWIESVKNLVSLLEDNGILVITWGAMLNDPHCFETAVDGKFHPLKAEALKNLLETLGMNIHSMVYDRDVPWTQCPCGPNRRGVRFSVEERSGYGEMNSVSFKGPIKESVPRMLSDFVKEDLLNTSTPRLPIRPGRWHKRKYNSFIKASTDSMSKFRVATKNTKCCKIISTYFGKRSDRGPKADRAWPIHTQFGHDASGVLGMVRDIVSMEKDVDAGVSCDTIIVNSDVGFIEGNKYIEGLHKQRTKSGRMFSFTIPNNGGKFGAYNFVYDKLYAKYEYWMFDEDDIIITGHHYYKNLIERLAENEKCYALIGLVEHPHHPTTAGGTLLLMHKEVLRNIKGTYGSLPQPKDNEKESRIYEGEIAWTQRIFELGYKIVYKGKSIQGQNVEWDYKTDYCIPYREMIEKFKTVDDFKQTEFFKGVKKC